MDVQRYLADEPVEACPPSMAYRLRKFARRNRTGLAAAALVTLALVLGTAVSIWQAVWATRARDAERAARVAEREARDALDAAREEQERRRARTDRELSEALVEAVRLQGKVGTARTGDRESANQLRAALGRVETLAASELADPALVARVRALQAEVSKEEKDRRMVARLEEIRLTQGTHQEETLRTVVGGSAPAYEAAFRDYGIPLTYFINGARAGWRVNPSPKRVEEVARQIAASPIRDWLVAALDDCASRHMSLIQLLLPIARRVEENDPWLRQYFDARIHLNDDAFVRLAQQPEALRQPPAILVNVAQCMMGNGKYRAAAARLLREAQRQHPADLWINRMLTGCVHYDQGTPDESIGFLRVALAARPESLALHLELATALIGIGHHDEAIAVYRQATRLKPDNAYAYVALAKIYLQLRAWDGWKNKNARPDPDDAIAACRKALEIDPKATRASSLWAIALLIKGDPEGAAALVQKTAEADPKSAGRLYAMFASDLVLLYRKAMKGDKPALRAEEQKLLHDVDAAYLKAMECATRLGDNHEELKTALSLWRSVPRPDQDWDGALAAYRKLIDKLIDLNPKEKDWHSLLGDFLAGNGDWDGAVAAYREASRCFPFGASLYDCRAADALRSKGDLDGAIAMYRKVIERPPESSVPRLARLGLAQALADKPDRGGAIAAYREFLRLAPADAEAAEALCGLLDGAGRREEALAAFREAIDPRQNWDAYQAAGARFEQKGRLDLAIALYQEVLRHRPDLALVRELLGGDLPTGRKPEAAMAVYRAALGCSPGNASGYASLAEALARLGERPRAIAAWREAIRCQPGVVWGYPQLAGLQPEARELEEVVRLASSPLSAQQLCDQLQVLGLLDNGVAACRRRIGQRPEEASPRLVLSVALERQARPEEAVAAAGEWIRAQPRSAEPLLRRAELYQRLDRVEEALADLSRATEVDPSCGLTVWAAQAALYTRLRQWDKAVADYSKVLKRGPRNTWALDGRANAHLQLGQWDKAAEDYTRLIVVAPGASSPWHGRGVARSNAGRYEEAVADFSRAIELSPAFWLAWHNRGLALARLGRWERAAADHAKALELMPRVDWQNNLAWLLATCPEAKVRNPARAVALAQQAVDANPKEGAFWTTLGVAHYRAGDWKAARAALVKSVELARGPDALNAFFLAMTHWQLGDKDEARKWYDRAVERMSMNEELWRVRAEAAALMGVGDPLPPFAEVRKAIDQAHALAGQGQWQKAAAEYARAGDAFPGEAGLWLEYASALLLADNPEGYRRACANILRRLGAVTDPDTCYVLARIASLAPGGGDPVQAVQRAEKGVAAHAKQAWYLHTLAVAHYRAGQFDQAVRRAEQSLKDDPAWEGHVVDWLLLAMAHQRLGHGDEARRWLDKAVQWIDQAGKGLPKESRFALPVPSWGDRLEIQLLRREAEDVLELRKK
jgi:tetratricopeptide (TPR) repeat protein